MTVFNKRNALVGFITLKALERRRRRNRIRRNAPKIALFLVLGLISFGILAGLAAVVVKRQRGETEQIEAVGEASESEIVGEDPTASSEPIPAT